MPERTSGSSECQFLCGTEFVLAIMALIPLVLLTNIAKQGGKKFEVGSRGLEHIPVPIPIPGALSFIKSTILIAHGGEICRQELRDRIGDKEIMDVDFGIRGG